MSTTTTNPGGGAPYYISSKAPHTWSFIGVTFQGAQLAVLTDNSQSISFDTCHFEGLSNGVHVTSASTVRIDKSHFGNTGQTADLFELLDTNGVVLSKFDRNGALNIANTLGTAPAASVSSSTSFPALLVDNSGIGDIFTASKSGSTKFVINNAGNVGIGTNAPLFKLDLQSAQPATGAAQIFNTDTGINSTGLILKLGNTAATTSTTNHWLSFEQSRIGIVGSVQGNGNATINYKTNGTADFAEYIPKDSQQNIPWGSVTCITILGKLVPCTSQNSKIVGIASQYPTFTGGVDKGNESITVGLTGVVSTIVSSENGSIQPGDLITFSNKPGVGVKSTHSGEMVGRAMETYASTDPQETGKILVSVNVNSSDSLSTIMNSGSTTAIMPEYSTPSQFESTLSQQQSQIASMSSQLIAVDGLADQLHNLQLQVNTLQGSSSSIENASDMSVKKLDSETLTVTGRTVLSDVGVTGTLSSGLLVMNGMNTSTGTAVATINTLSGPLQLQSDGLHGVDMINGKVLVDTNGNMDIAGVVKAKQFAVDASDPATASIGKAILKAGQTKVIIETSAVHTDSSIFTSPESVIDYPLAVTEKQDKKTFTVQTSHGSAKDIPFRWWIIN